MNSDTPTTSTAAKTDPAVATTVKNETINTSQLLDRLIDDDKLGETEEESIVPSCHAVDEPRVNDLMTKTVEYPSVFPDALTLSIMQECGVEAAEDELVRAVALMAQKTVSDIILDAHSMARLKGLATVKKGSKEPKFTLTQDLLEEALKEWGIDCKKPPYFQ